MHIQTSPSNTDAAPIKTRLLPTEPADADAFQSSPHKRIAETLARELKRMLATGGAIGIEGNWGSGKSTVIEITKALLSRDKADTGQEYRFFTYDFWTHQADPFRHSFLEDLLHWTRSQNLISDTTFEETIMRINARVEETKTTNSTILTWPGAALLLLAPILPFAYTTINTPDFTTRISTWMYWLSIVALALPSALALFIWLTQRPSGGFREAASLLAQKGHQEHSRKEVRDRNPTTNEFADLLRSTVTAAASRGNQIVIVLDNIDRLPSELLKGAWAEIRSLIGTKLPQAEYSKVIFLVPYDKKHVLAAFTDASLSPGTDVLEKTFQSRIQVTPPIMSDWRQFFFNKMTEAFDAATNNEFNYTLFRLLDEHLINGQRHPTPRYIISFVNSIVSLHEQWGQEIPLSSLGAYVLNKDKLDVSLASLRDTSILSETEKALLQSEWQRHFAALTFNVALDVAYQVLLQEEIELALRTNNSETLSRLAQSPGFNSVLLPMLDKKAITWAGETPVEFSNACKSLASLQIADEERAYATTRMVNALGKLAPPRSLRAVEMMGLGSFLDLANSNLRKNASSKIATWLSGLATDGHNATEWVNLLAELAEILAKTGGSKERLAFVKSVYAPPDATNLCDAAVACAKSGKLSLADLIIKTGEDDIKSATVQRASENDPDLNLLVEELFNATGFDTNELLDVVIAKLREPSLVNDNALRASYLRALAQLTFENEANQSKVVPLLKDGTMLLVLERSHSNAPNAVQNEIVEYTIPFYFLLARFANGSPPTPEQNTLGSPVSALSGYTTLRDNPIEESVAKSLANLFGTNNQFALVRENAIAGTHIFQAILKVMIHDNTFNRLNTKNAVTQFGPMAQIVGHDLSVAFLRRFEAWSGRLDEAFKGATNEVPDEFLDAVRAAGAESMLWTIFDIIESHLKSIDAAGWVAALAGSTDDIRLLLQLLRTRKTTLVVATFRDPLFDYALGILNGEPLPARHADEWYLLPSALPPQAKKTFFKSLAGRMDPTLFTTAAILNFLTLFKTFWEDTPLEEHADTITEKVLVPIYSSANEAALVGHDAAIAKCIKHSSKDAVKALKEALDGRPPDAAPVEDILKLFKSKK